jgi:hypothetical protein
MIRRIGIDEHRLMPESNAYFRNVIEPGSRDLQSIA